MKPSAFTVAGSNASCPSANISSIGHAVFYRLRSLFVTGCLLLILGTYSLYGQTPQGFTYQALAMTAVGEPIRNQALPVRITIQSDSLGGTIFWLEEHPSVATNSTGFFTLIVGKGTRLSGAAATFADIDWTVMPKFIKTEINNGTWQTMGSSRLWSVPYAMTAGDITGSLKKLEVAGDATAMDDALFEVKNKNGHTVFAVYNEGVRIYVGDGTSKAVKGGFAIGTFDESKADTLNLMVVNKDSVRVYIYDDPLNKAVKGGFAIGGFDESKSLTNDYLLVSPDSVRVYIDKDATKAVKGGFAIGGFDMSKAPGQEYLRITNDSVRIYIDDQSKAVKGGFAIGGFDELKTGGKSFFDVSTSSGGVIEPSENRILWYPLKNAFLTGKVLIQDPDSVGINSFASGYESKAKGQYSQALGYQAIARGDYSTAIGKNAVANQINSFAFGENATAINEESFAFGRGSKATGFRSYAFGSAAVDSAGQLTGATHASGDYSVAIGQGSQALGKGAFSIGLADTAKGSYSMALGYKTIASGWYSASMGSNTKALGEYSTAMGAFSVASNLYSVAMGFGTRATGEYSMSMGHNTVASGRESTALGYNTIASGYQSVSMGFLTKASGDASVAMGSWTTASGSLSAIAMGYATTASGDASTSLGYWSVASGEMAATIGRRTKANTYCMIAIGSYNDTTRRHGNDSYWYWYDDDPLFVVGKGTEEANRSNALTILKNGRIGIQSIINPVYALEFPNNITTGIGSARAYSWATYSDGRAKTDRRPLSYGLDEVMQLNPQSYYHHSTESKGGRVDIKPDGAMDIGLIAQEVFNVIPEAVTRPVSEDSDLWSLSYDKLVPVLVKAIQEQQGIIELQNAKIDLHNQENMELKSELLSLRSEVESLQALKAEVEELRSLKTEVEALKTMIISGNK